MLEQFFIYCRQFGGSGNGIIVSVGVPDDDSVL
jgi:hypothetical protein